MSCATCTILPSFLSKECTVRFSPHNLLRWTLSLLIFFVTDKKVSHLLSCGTLTTTFANVLESSHDGCLTVFIRLFLTLTIFIQIVFLYLFLPHSLHRHIFPVPHNDSCLLSCYLQFCDSFQSLFRCNLLYEWFTIPLNTAS